MCVHLMNFVNDFIDVLSESRRVIIFPKIDKDWLYFIAVHFFFWLVSELFKLILLDLEFRFQLL